MSNLRFNLWINRVISTFSFKLTVVILILLISLATVLLSIHYFSSRTAALGFTESLMASMGKQLNVHIDEFFGKNHIRLTELARQLMEDQGKITQRFEHDLVYSLYKQKEVASVFYGNEDGIFLQARRNDTTHILRRLDANTFEDSWNYVDAQGKVTTKVEKSSYDHRNRGWYQEVKDNHQAYITPPYRFASNNVLGVTLAIPFVHKNQLQGVLAMDISMEDLNGFMEDLAREQEGFLEVLNTSGYPVVSTDKNNELGLQGDAKTQALRDECKGQTSARLVLNGDFYRCAHRDFQLLDSQQTLDVYFIKSEDKILGPAMKSLHQGILVSLGFLAFFVLLSYLAAQRISHPITQIAKRMRQVKELRLEEGTTFVDSKIYEIREAQKALASLELGLKSIQRYLPEVLVKDLIHQGNLDSIKAEEKQLVIMFTDIQGFTGISEGLAPPVLTAYLADYFSILSKVITQSGGTIDKYIGDAVMVFWGAPHSIEHAADKALAAAMKIQQQLDIQNQHWADMGRPVMITRMGLHYGTCMVGSIGSFERVNYTIIGDAVNVAARLESANKNYHTRILMSDSFVQQLTQNQALREVDRVELRGKSQSMLVYTPIL